MRYLQFCAVSAIALTVGAPMLSASAQESGEEVRRFEAITVTAQKREQNLQDVPLAVTAINEQTLEITGSADVQALSRIAPSLSFGDSVNSRSRANFIRGLGTQSLSDGVETGVGTFVDGVIMGRDFQGFGLFDDVERVEVLRGPQGTLFGKNTSAGVIQIITRDPTYEFEGRASVSYATDDEITARGTINLPLAEDMAALRISAYTTSHDGIVRNAVTGQDVNENDGQGIRAKLLFEPSPDLAFRLSADFQQTDELCCDFTFRDAPPPDPASPTPFLTAFGALTLAGQHTSVIGEGNRVSFSNTPTGEETENKGLSLQIDKEFDGFKLVSVTSYREGDIFEFNGADFGPLTVLDVASTDSSTEQFTQELRIESTDPDAVLQYVGGVYLFDQSVDSVQRFDGVDLVTFGLASAGIVPAPTLPPQEQTTLHGADYDNWALFGQATYSVTDRFRVTAGLRYTSDEVTAYVDRESAILFNAGTAIVPIFGNGSFTAETDAEEVSGRLILEYDVSDDVMVFGSVARGYKGPAVQVDPLFRGADTLPIVAPEIPMAYELGLRSQFANGRVTFNATAFLTEVDDYQAAAFDPEALSFLLQNVGEAETSGLEIEAEWLATDALRFSGNVSFVDGEIKSFPGASCYTAQTEAAGCINGSQDLSGADLPNAPETSFYVAADYLFDLSDSIDGSFHIGYAWRDDTQFSLNNNPGTIQDAYGLLDANLRLNVSDRWTFDVFGRNLTDEDYASFIASAPVYASFFGDPSTSQIPARGQVIGARIGVEF